MAKFSICICGPLSRVEVLAQREGCDLGPVGLGETVGGSFCPPLGARATPASLGRLRVLVALRFCPLSRQAVLPLPLQVLRGGVETRLVFLKRDEFYTYLL